MDAAYHFAEDAALDGCTVVSGLAFGIDACAHQGALAAKGKTACVLAGGVDGASPASNKRLAGAILVKGGCMVSEYTPGTPPDKLRFPQRNRIIAGLSDATVVIDAPGNSGALITADFALEAGRDVYIHRVSLSQNGHTGAENTGTGKKGFARLITKYIEAGAPVIDSYGDYCSVRDREKEGSTDAQLNFEGVGEWRK